MMPKWARHVFHTKPGNPRFLRYAGNIVEVRGLGDLWPTSFEDARCAPFCVEHLREAEGVALQRELLGKHDYDPALDIDRYRVLCGSVDGHVERCAVFEELHALVEDQRCTVRDGDPAGDDGAGQPRVRGGDGGVGPVSAVVHDEFEFIPGMAHLVQICKACEHCRNCGERKRGDGNDGGEDAAHAGIIAYLRGIWRKAREGRRKQC